MRNLPFDDYLIHTALSSYNPSALRHHVRVKDIATWNINAHNEHQEPLVILMHILLRMVEREVHEHAFGGDADGIQHEEGVVPVHVSQCPNLFTQKREGEEEKYLNHCHHPGTSNPPSCNTKNP